MMRSTDDPIIDQTGRTELPPEARADLAYALALLAGGGGRLARAAAGLARVAGMATAPLVSMMGRAIGLRGTPAGNALTPVIAQIMERAFDVATIALSGPADEPAAAASPLPLRSRVKTGARRSRLAAIASGLVGGAAGLPGFVPDAAFTTLLILRNIAAIAVREGENLATEASRAACIEVFTLGAPVVPTAIGVAAAAASTDQDSYWTARLLMQGTPLMALISQAASRFGVVLSEKLALQAAPIAGAAGGALINAAFLDHYRALAEGHFIIRRLERQYGVDTVRWAAQR